MWCKYLNIRRTLPPPDLVRERERGGEKGTQCVFDTWFSDVNSNSGNFVSFKMTTISFIRLSPVTASYVLAVGRLFAIQVFTELDMASNDNIAVDYHLFAILLSLLFYALSVLSSLVVILRQHSDSENICQAICNRFSCKILWHSVIEFNKVVWTI